MPNYKVNDEAVRHARSLIDDGAFDDETPWSEAAPSADDVLSHLDRKRESKD